MQTGTEGKAAHSNPKTGFSKEAQATVARPQKSPPRSSNNKVVSNGKAGGGKEAWDPLLSPKHSTFEAHDVKNCAVMRLHTQYFSSHGSDCNGCAV
ncbi:hypothetical protein STEG23_032754 [Scotinomys teguina]